MTPETSRDPFELIAVPLTDEERLVLSCGLSEWGGPARCTDELAFAMGFGTVDELLAEKDRLWAVVRRGDAMSRFDWWRTLIATEIVFASDLVGSGRDWCATTGLRDEETIRILRSLQAKLVGVAMMPPTS